MTADLFDGDGEIPVLTLGWRMLMALRHAGVSMHDMAEELGVTRETCSRWSHDKGAPPRAAFVKMWALRTGVPYRWIAYGDAGSPRPTMSDGGSALCARRDSNPQPSDP